MSSVRTSEMLGPLAAPERGQAVRSLQCRTCLESLDDGFGRSLDVMTPLQDLDLFPSLHLSGSADSQDVCGRWYQPHLHGGLRSHCAP